MNPDLGRVYLAARYSRNDEMRGVRDVLGALNYTVTSRWIDQHGGQQLESAANAVLNSDPASVAHFGVHDIEDLRVADTVVSFTSADGGGKGGRHVEFGMAHALEKRLILVGPREHIFHTLPEVEHHHDWSSFVRALASAQSGDREAIRA